MTFWLYDVFGECIPTTVCNGFLMFELELLITHYDHSRMSNTAIYDCRLRAVHSRTPVSTAQPRATIPMRYLQQAKTQALLGC